MEKSYKILNLECVKCAKKVESAISKIKGVKRISIDFETKIMVIDCSEKAIKEALEELSDRDFEFEEV